MSIFAEIRTDYMGRDLRKKDLYADPVQQFQNWFQSALDAKIPDPNAMTLATADKTGRPSARMVLLKGLDERGFSFFTNYRSKKGKELLSNPRASLVFYWPQLHRQICVCGDISKLSAEESETYFVSRPIGSRLAAWASKQSAVIESREVLESALKEVTKRFKNQNIPLPPYWGGFLLKPKTIEFWQGRPSRLHDRFRYTRKKESWKIDRLSP
jgi:pyridoxamine 5'-phosphate oxidase